MSSPVQTIPYLHREITESIREEIASGKIPVGSRLPSMNALAKERKTSAFTIWRAVRPLVNEGLLESRGRLGMVVVEPKPKLSRVGIYYGADVWNMQETTFYRVLHQELEKQLRSFSVSINFLVDRRMEGQPFEPDKELIRAVEERSIQGLIIPLANLQEMEWLKKLPVLKAVFGTAEVPWRVLKDSKKEMLAMLTSLKEQGVRKVGILGSIPMEASVKHPWTMFYQAFIETVADLGMETRNAWCVLPQELLKPQELEEFGYDAFLRLWANAERPEGIISVSDVAGKGSLTAIIQEQIAVPNDLKVVQYKNKGVGFFTPLPVTWMVTDETQVAAALIDLIRRQVNEESVEEALITGQIVSAHS